MNRRILRLAAWAALVGIALIALLPAGTILTHPSTMGDRMFRYAVLAILFVLAYPRSLPAVMAVTIGCAVCLEALQLLIPSKTANPMHVLPKLAGISLGITLAFTGMMFSRR